jgi:hypothetical protein
MRLYDSHTPKKNTIVNFKNNFNGDVCSVSIVLFPLLSLVKDHVVSPFSTCDMIAQC